jgi:hypothetical protein
VPGFGNFPCSGCGEQAAISTKIGLSVTCPCGVVHVTKGVVVETTGACSNPRWAEKASAADREARR